MNWGKWGKPFGKFGKFSKPWFGKSKFGKWPWWGI